MISREVDHSISPQPFLTFIRKILIDHSLIVSLRDFITLLMLSKIFEWRWDWDSDILSAQKGGTRRTCVMMMIEGGIGGDLSEM